MLLIGLVPALVGKSSFSWVGPARWAVFGVAVGVAFAVVVLGRRELVVTAGTFHGYPALDEVTSNQILGIDLVQHWWGRNVHLTVIGGHSTPVPIMSWRIWPDADFEEQMRGLRLALGMPADPPPDIG
jgi:hypothetical protein